MKKIYVIATDEQTGYEEDSTKPIFTTIILSHFGAWKDKTTASLKALELNSKDIPEDDSAFENDAYYVLGIKIND